MWKLRCLWRCRESIGLIETCKGYCSTKFVRNLPRHLLVECKSDSLGVGLVLAKACGAATMGRLPAVVAYTSLTTPIATPHLPRDFFAHPCEQVTRGYFGCLLVNHQAGSELLWGVIVETEAEYQ